MTIDGYLDVRAAAEYVGYTPAKDALGRWIPAHKDRQIRCFYEWVRRHDVQTAYRGRRLLFRRSWLDRALDRCTEDQQAQQRDRREAMADLARRHARGEIGAR
jgi:hypothetical protein